MDLAWEMGHRRKAQDASINARNLAIGGIIIGVMILILYVILVALGATGHISYPGEITST